MLAVTRRKRDERTMMTWETGTKKKKNRKKDNTMDMKKSRR
jgi:hypothetical protein